MAKECLDVTAAMKHVENHHAFILAAVNDDTLAHGESAQAGAQIVAAASDIRVCGKQVKSFGEGFNETLRPVGVAAFLRDEIPNTTTVRL